jgi:hypothetical protein
MTRDDFGRLVDVHGDTYEARSGGWREARAAILSAWDALQAEVEALRANVKQGAEEHLETLKQMGRERDRALAAEAEVEALRAGRDEILAMADRDTVLVTEARDRALKAEAEVERLADFVNACVKGGSDWMERARAAEARVEVLRTALDALLTFVQQQRALGNIKGPVEVCVRARAALTPEVKP